MLFIVTLFLFVYNIPLHIIHLPFSSGKIITIISVFYFISVLIEKQRLNFKYVFLIYFLYVLGIIVTVFLVNHIIYNTDDSYYLTIPAFYIIEYLFGSLFLVKVFRISSIKKLIHSFLVIGIIQALIMLLSLFVPFLKDIVFAVMKADPQSLNFSGFEKLEAEDYFRGFALAADRTLGMSVFLSNMLMMLSLNIYNSAKLKLLTIMSFCLAFVVIAIGGLLSARTFFVGLSLNFILMIIFLLTRHRHSIGKRNVKVYLRGVLIFLVVTAVLLPLTIHVFYPQQQDMLDLAYNWAFEIFINFFQSGKLETSSTSDLFTNHLSILPSDLKTILIGDEQRTFVNGIHYMGQFTDSGYLRMVFVFGILGSLPFYIFWIWVLFQIYKYNNQLKGIGFFVFLLGLNLYICQIKYDVFPGSSINFKTLILLLVVGVLNTDKLIKKNENTFSGPSIP